MRQILAAGIFALGCSFALVALRGGDHVHAAMGLMAACSTAALVVRALGDRVRDLP